MASGKSNRTQGDRSERHFSPSTLFAPFDWFHVSLATLKPKGFPGDWVVFREAVVLKVGSPGQPQVPRNLLEVQILGPPPRLPEPRPFAGLGSSIQGIHELELENHCTQAKPFTGAQKAQSSGSQSLVPQSTSLGPGHPPFPPGNRRPNESGGRPFVYMKHNNIRSLFH